MTEVPGLQRDPAAAAEMAVNAVLHYLRQCGITNQEEKKAWLARVFDEASARVGRAN